MIWAEKAAEDGKIVTLEGSTEYKIGDYLIFDREEGGDGYAIKKAIFEDMYVSIDEQPQLTPEQETHINDRILAKIDEHKKKVKQNKTRCRFCQVLSIAAAGFIPFFSVFESKDQLTFKVIVAILGGVSAAAGLALSKLNFEKNWLESEKKYKDLESHYSQFNISAGIYWDKRTAFDLLVENCEGILNAPG